MVSASCFTRESRGSNGQLIGIDICKTQKNGRYLSLKVEFGGSIFGTLRLHFGYALSNCLDEKGSFSDR